MAKVIFTNGNVFDGQNPSRAGLSIVVENDRIAAVVEGQTQAGSGDRVIDLAGRTLMPGLGSSHYHAEYDHFPLSGTVGRVYLGMEKPPGYIYALCIENLRRALQQGLTSVVGAGCSYDSDATLKMAIDDGKIPGPRIFAASRHLDPTGNDNDWSPWWYNMAESDRDGIKVAGSEIICDGADAFRKATRMEFKRGARMIKVFPTGGHGLDVDDKLRGMRHEELVAVIEAAHERGALVRGHVITRDVILECIEAGMDVIDHGDEIDDEIIEAMVKHGTFFTPSMMFLKRLLGTSTGSIHGVSMDGPAERSFKNLVKMLPKANAAGVKIVPGDDFGLSFMPHDEPGIYAKELEIYVKDCGISAREVLKWSTHNVAALMGRSKELGGVAPGMLADLLVVRGDPTKDITLLTDPERNLDAVMVGGRFVKDRALDVPARAAAE